MSKSTKATSPVRGRSTSQVEVQGISKNGLWIFVKNREYFLPYQEYPWFKEAKVAEIYSVELLHGSHLYWPDLNVDLELESLEHPAEFPLTYK
jgi:hypothetical protein